MTTVEGRPALDVNWEHEYAKQRKSRLVDAVYEYMEDDVPADTFVETILDTIREYSEYHEQKACVSRQYIDSISTIVPR